MKISPTLVLWAISATVIISALVMAAAVISSFGIPDHQDFTQGSTSGPGVSPTPIVVTSGSLDDPIVTAGPAPTPLAGDGDIKGPAALEMPDDPVYVALSDPGIQDELAKWGTFRISGISSETDPSGKKNLTIVTFAPGDEPSGRSMTAVVDRQKDSVVEVRHGNGTQDKPTATPDNPGQGKDKDKDKADGDQADNDEGGPSTGKGSGGQGNGQDKDSGGQSNEKDNGNGDGKDKDKSKSADTSTDKPKKK